MDVPDSEKYYLQSLGTEVASDSNSINFISTEAGKVEFADESNANLAGSDSEQSCRLDVQSFGLNTLFDMEKIVENVKIKVKTKWEEKKKQPEVYCSNKQKNEERWKEGKKNTLSHQSDQCSLKDEQKCDSDSSFGLTAMFEQKKPIHKRRRKAKKVNKITKRTTEDDSYGLELLFREENIGKKRKKRKDKKMVNYDETASEDQEEEKVKKKRPNYFVAIRVSDPAIHLAIQNFQDAVLKENEKLKPALIPLVSLHITMALMHLDEAQLKVAQDALERCKFKMLEALKTINFKLKFSGIGNFNNEVVFAKVAEKEQVECLQTINSVVTAALEEDGITLSDKNEWKPHLTILKLSRNRSLKKSGIKKVEESVYASWIAFCFGVEIVQGVHLCSMLGAKEGDGFYKCLSTVTFTDNSKTDFN